MKHAIGVVLATLLVIGGHFVGGAAAQTWDLAADFLLAPDQANPSPDRYGNPGVWTYAEGPPIHEILCPFFCFPGVSKVGDPFNISFALLPQFVSNVSGIAGLEQWQSTPGANQLPAVGINTTGAPQTIGSTLIWPAGVVRLEPSGDRSAVLQWRSTITGLIRLDGMVEPLNHPGCRNVLTGVFVHTDIHGRLAKSAVATLDVFDFLFPLPELPGATALPVYGFSVQPLPVEIGDTLTWAFGRGQPLLPLPGSEPVGCNAISVGLKIVVNRTVGIDIKPGNSENHINTKSHGIIPVAILSTASFDAPSEVDRASLTFGSTGDEASLVACNPGRADVNGDGLPDLVCRFATQRTSLAAGDSVGVLKGQTLDGTPLTGTDSVIIVH